METKNVIVIPDQNCVNCSHFSWWDGDFCCTKHMKVLQEANDANFNDGILIAIEENKDCEDWKKCDPNFLGRENGLFWDRFVAYLMSKLKK